MFLVWVLGMDTDWIKIVLKIRFGLYQGTVRFVGTVVATFAKLQLLLWLEVRLLFLWLIVGSH